MASMRAVPIVFFGTLEIAWLAQSDVVFFRDGLEQGLWNKCKNKSFYKAMVQVSCGRDDVYRGGRMRP